MERQVLRKFLAEHHEGDPHQIDQALRDPRYRTMSAEEAVVAAGAVTERVLCALQAHHLGLQVVHLDHVTIPPDVLKLIPFETCRNYTLVPYASDPQVCTVAMADPEDRVAEEVVRFVTRRTTTCVMATRSEILAAISRCYTPPAEPPLQRLLRNLPEPGTVLVRLPGTRNNEPERPLDPSEIGPIARMLNTIIVEAIRLRASDIHVESVIDGLRIRYRIDGLLSAVAELPLRLQRAFVGRIKTLGGLEQTECRRPQEGRAYVTTANGHADLQVTTVPSAHGENVVIRLLDNCKAQVRNVLPGLLPGDRERLSAVTALSQGMVICTGPTGSGRTSTLYSVISRRDASIDNVMTVEKPVELYLHGVVQVPVVDMSFAAAVQATLAQRPTVLMLGDLPDDETTHLALEAAQDGCLVVGPSKTRDAVSVIGSLQHRGTSSHQVATSLSCIIGQRLVRQMCSHCREEVEPQAGTLAMVAHLGLVRPPRTFVGKGCSECNYSGFRGRVGLFEVLVMNERVRDLVAASAPDRDVLQAARHDGMASVLEDGIRKVALGWTTLEEVLRVAASEGPGWHRCPTCGKPQESSYNTCPYCSEGLTRRCPSCGHGVEQDWITCAFCRLSLAEVPGGPAVVVPPPMANRSVEPTLPDVPDTGHRLPDLILLVDDDDIGSTVVRYMLENEGGFRVMMAENGVQALQIATAERPQLILSDIMMPEMDGLELVHHLKAQLSTALIPIILMTSQHDRAAEMKAFESGVDDYLRKPVEQDRLLARVGAVLRRTALKT